MTDAARLSDSLVASAIAVLALALLAYATAAALVRTRVPVPAGVSGSDRSDPAATTGRVAIALVGLGTALMVAAVLARAVAAGRAPWGNMYEFGLAGAAAVGVVFLVWGRHLPVPAVGVWVTALALLLLGISITLLYTPVDDLVPVLDSLWLVVHVAAAITAGALFTLGAVVVGVELLRRRRGRDTTALARVSHTVHLIAFPVWTFAVIAGAVWAENAWGRYWGWDPKETWAFITWVFYAAYLHALSTPRWRRGAGVLALAGFAAFLFNFFGVNIWLPGLHSYAGV